MYAQVRLGAARRLEAQWGMQEDGGGSLDEQVHLLLYALCLMPYALWRRLARGTGASVAPVAPAT